MKTDNLIREECPFCFGTGKRYVDIGDDNDVEVTCDGCHGRGYEERNERSDVPKTNKPAGK